MAGFTFQGAVVVTPPVPVPTPPTASGGGGGTLIWSAVTPLDAGWLESLPEDGGWSGETVDWATGFYDAGVRPEAEPPLTPLDAGGASGVSEENPATPAALPKGKAPPSRKGVRDFIGLATGLGIAAAGHATGSGRLRASGIIQAISEAARLALEEKKRRGAKKPEPPRARDEPTGSSGADLI